MNIQDHWLSVYAAMVATESWLIPAKHKELQALPAERRVSLEAATRAFVATADWYGQGKNAADLQSIVHQVRRTEDEFSDRSEAEVARWLENLGRHEDLRHDQIPHAKGRVVEQQIYQFLDHPKLPCKCLDVFRVVYQRHPSEAGCEPRFRSPTSYGYARYIVPTSIPEAKLELTTIQLQNGVPIQFPVNLVTKMADLACKTFDPGSPSGQLASKGLTVTWLELREPAGVVHAFITHPLYPFLPELLSFTSAGSFPTDPEYFPVDVSKL